MLSNRLKVPLTIGIVNKLLSKNEKAGAVDSPGLPPNEPHAQSCEPRPRLLVQIHGLAVVTISQQVKNLLWLTS